MKKRLGTVEPTKKTSAPLIVEKHPVEYTGYPFVTVIVYRKQPMLAIIDNFDDETIKAYILDYCGAEGVNEEQLIVAAAEWYVNSNQLFPISIEFSRRGMTNETSRVYRSLNVEYISRVIGPVPKFPMSSVKNVKRRRRKSIPQNVEIYTVKLLTVDEFFQQ